MSELQTAVDTVWSEFNRMPEIETVEGREVFDKQGRVVAIFNESRDADTFVTLMVELPDLFEQAPWVIAEVGESHNALSDLRDRIAEQNQVISGLRKIVAEQRRELDLKK